MGRCVSKAFEEFAVRCSIGVNLVLIEKLFDSGLAPIRVIVRRDPVKLFLLEAGLALDHANPLLGTGAVLGDSLDRSGYGRVERVRVGQGEAGV